MDTNINPQISIITITRNRAGFISKAIESAQKQSFSGWELIVLDDDSNDNTGAIVEAFKAKDNRVKYYKNPLL
jgi:glycosyltransferase involved in cell wall biosynthesis